MSDEIIINGRHVASSDQESDASSSDYILIRTKGEPLNKKQKKQLKDLGVIIHEFVGDEHGQVYLCGYKEKPLDEIRGLDYVDYANVYSPTFVIPNLIQTAVAQADGYTLDNTIEVDVLLHHDIKEASRDLVKKVANAADVAESAISIEQGSLRVKVHAENLERIAALDEVRVIHEINELSLFNNVARRILHSDNPGIGSTVYKGQGQTVCVADTGFDKGSTTDVHDAFTGRVKKLFPWGRTDTGSTDDLDGHGTHVCGSVLGSGQHNSQGLIEGTAPAATLIMQSTFSGFNASNRSQLGGIPNDLTRLFDQAYKQMPESIATHGVLRCQKREFSVLTGLELRV